MQTAQNKNIITSSGIYKSFETGGRYTNVLKDVSLDIREGEFLIVFGPSGCGKSTLLHIIMGLERPDAGIVKLEGMDLWTLSTEDRANTRKREIGIMYQQQNWIKSLSVQENIAFSGQLIGLEKEEALLKAQEVLKIVGMDFRTEYIPSELSAGEQQKIGLARALMTDPKVIIADEPTGNLDVKSGQEMMSILSKLNDSGKTIVMVTHNPEYLKDADRVVFMLDGRIRREVLITPENSEKVQEEIFSDLQKFIESGTTLESQDIKAPPPINSIEQVKKRKIFQKIFYAISFNIRFLFQSVSYLWLIFLRLWGKKNTFFVNQATKFKEKFAKASRKLDRNLSGKISSSINSIDLTEISFRNLWAKKSRTSVTIFGMSIGIGFIVFLLSLGYGLERLVINEITRIEDMRQVDIMPTVSSNVNLDATNMQIISDISGVKDVLPLVNLAARVEYEQSSTDVVVYGVQAKYIQDSPITIISGDIFNDEQRDVVVNNEFITTIGVLPEDVLGKELGVDFVVSELTLDDENTDEVEDNRRSYTISGVVEDNNPAVIYVPIIQLEEFDLSEFSQVRITIESEDQILDVRRQIEVLGFETTSVMDTVSEVESLFSYAKIGLLIVGAIALSIAILGMFNTLTVSLLERTREVGLMKTIGMKADEIRSLFINESMIMGITGGALGVLFGMLMGFVVSLIFSIFSVSRGGNFIMVSFLPIYLIIGIVVVSTFVGFLTGLYPSSRAVKMAPLDALRYE
jgi:ABC-type lipoprotein export system ATPase subunit/ABC-type lipoprotein release transport system permease subunit